MSDQETRDLLREIAELRAILEEIKEQQGRDRSEWRQDKADIWAAIGKTNENISDLSKAVAAGRGGLRVVVWVGTVILGVSTIVIGLLNYFKH